MQETAADMIAKKRPGDVLLLVWQTHQLDDTRLALDLFDKALGSVKDVERRFLGLMGIDFLWKAEQWTRLAMLLEEILADEPFARHSGLGRLAAEVAPKAKTPARAAAYLEKALDLEYRHLPEVVNVETLRTDYQALLNHYVEITKAANLLGQPAPKDLIAKVVKAADRWRARDPEATVACPLAAPSLANGGGREATELAWEYLTTPIAHKPSEAQPWLDLAAALAKDNIVGLADRAYAAAYQAEPTNAQILWDRAEHLQQHGRMDQARSL